MLLDSDQQHQSHLDDASIGVDDPHDAYQDVLQAASSMTTMRRCFGLKLLASSPSTRDQQRIMIKKRPLSLLTSYGNQNNSNKLCGNDEHSSSTHSHLVDEAVRIVGAHNEFVRSSSTSSSPNKRIKLTKKNGQQQNKKKKTVRFADSVQVAYCDGEHIDYTSKDFGLIWYSKQDYDSFKDECRRTLYHLDNSGPSSYSSCCGACGCDCYEEDNNRYCDCQYDDNSSIISHQSTHSSSTEAASASSYHCNNTFDYYNYCIRGLEEQITPEIYHTRKSRKEYYVRSILQEQEFQRKQYGYDGSSSSSKGQSYQYDPNKFKMISMIQTKQCKEFALEIAKLDSTIHDE